MVFEPLYIHPRHVTPFVLHS